ncbi:MAG: polyphenol oxidase family protein [Candidatus Sumerlaeota bacterium]|nr:polyphenol oxidase family protein [Candidatus Sumerlaeota bacterium]
MADHDDIHDVEIPWLAGISWLACDLMIVATGDWRRDRAGLLREQSEHLGVGRDVAVVSCYQTHGDAVAVMDEAHPLYRHAVAAVGRKQGEAMKGRTMEGEAMKGRTMGVRTIPSEEIPTKGADDTGINILLPQTDAVILNEAGFLAAVATADCVPVIAADVRCRRAAIIHAGWRGTYHRITQKTIRRIRTLGSRAEDLRVWIGPCIRRRNYEVGEDLIAKFSREFPEVPDAIDGRRLDLAAINIRQARVMGVDQKSICDSGNCTFEDARLPSFRREGDNAGRMLTRIVIRAGGRGQ